MAIFNKHNAFVENVYEKVHNLGADTLKLLATNVAPTAANAVKADLTEITAANGYSAGGPTVTITSSSQTGGTYSLVGNDVVITATGGSIGPLRYLDMYNDTTTSPADALISWWDYGSSVTLADGETFSWDVGASILQHA